MRGLIYFRNAKTGGSSITHSVRSKGYSINKGYPKVGENCEDKLFIFPIRKRNIPVVLNDDNDCVKFTSIRNPWGRFVSGFNFMKQEGAIEDIGIESFILLVEKMRTEPRQRTPEPFGNKGRKNRWQFIHNHVVLRQTEKLRELPTEERKKLHIIRYEKINEGYSGLFKLIGATENSLRWYKRTATSFENGIPKPRDYYKEMLSDSDIERIAALFADDIEEFGYEY